MRVAITGASGGLGSALSKVLTSQGHEIIPMVRRAAGPGEIQWSPEGFDASGLEGTDAVVHLAGATIARRWSKRVKSEVLHSRVDGTHAIASALASLAKPPQVLISSSAVGYYGDRSDVIDESAGTGEGFLADVCQQWEAAVAPATDAGIRTVLARTGIVLDATNGALPAMLGPFKMGLGGPTGSGQHWQPWITVDDWVKAVIHLISKGRGPANICVPEPVQQKEFAKTLGKVLRRPAFMPLPGFMVKLIFGEMGKELLLEGQRAVPAALQASGFTWDYPELEPALRHVLNR